MSRRSARQRGFTLVELLVALMVLALMSTLAWRGLDGMVRAQTLTQQRAQDVLALQNGLQQWAVDLDAMATELPVAPPAALPASGIAGGTPQALDWNGQVLRITRWTTVPDTTGKPGQPGVRVVAWSRHDVAGTPHWMRWQSDTIDGPGALQQAWQQAAAWAVSPDTLDNPHAVTLAALQDWQIFYFRGAAWSNPLSSTEAAAVHPDGVRLVLQLPAGGALTGTLTRDWIRPTLAGNKS